MRRLARTLFTLALVAAIMVGIASMFTDAYAKRPKPGGCFCPMVYAPVQCDQGIFSNQCVADCSNATNCVPIGPGPIPL